MITRSQKEEKVVFGLDIGTRSVVGTIGYQQENKFHVMAQKVKLHETRAMLDGQIHDIAKVSSTILSVKEELERETGIELTDVCIAAAGRVLRTVQALYEEEYEEEKNITQEDIYHLESRAVEAAYAEFMQKYKSDEKFFLVGYTVRHFYMNGAPIVNLEGHNLLKAGVDVIATFLPQDVVDGLYTACERAGLHVANLTLEPIAAIRVAIPEKFRSLNMALIDVGAGTSDICVTSEGTIIAYGMIPEAGDHLTEIIAQNCLVDFHTADQIKIEGSTKPTVTFYDVMGLEKTITAEEIQNMIHTQVELMADHATEMILQLNGDRPVQAVFVVGGGGCVPGYTKAIAARLGIPEERVALRGEEVMKNIIFPEQDEVAHDSLMVTPIGICISFYEETNNFVFVSFNGIQTKIYDNGKLTVADAAIQASFPNEDLFPKRGKELHFSVNGEERTVRGKAGEAAVIRVNGRLSSIHTHIHANDVIDVERSTAGEAGHLRIASLAEYIDKLHVELDGKMVELPHFATANGEPKSELYDIQEGDQVQIKEYDTAGQIAQLLDIPLTPEVVVFVNHERADADTKVYENFQLKFGNRDDLIMDAYRNFPDAEQEEDAEEMSEDSAVAEHKAAVNEKAEAFHQATGGVFDHQGGAPGPTLSKDLHVIVNDSPITLQGKLEYIFVDVFDYIDFDLSKPDGRSIVTQLNGSTPNYMQVLQEGDRIEIYWAKK